MQNIWFKDWFNSPYYHQLYANRDENEAASFINKLIQKLAPPANATMLDVACGKGRHSMQLAAHGFDVTGIDLSKESIKEALKSEGPHLHFFEHDMRLPFWINYFDYAFNFFTSFGYFETQREHNNAIRTIAGALKPGGKFVMDFLNVQATGTGVKEFTKALGGTNYNISKWADEHYFYKKIIVEDATQSSPLQYTEKVAKFSLQDFTGMFKAQQLTITKTYGDYNFGEFILESSPRLIMIAEKVGNS